MEKQGGTHVAVELGKAFLLTQVGVPNANDLENVELSGQVAGDPAVGEVHEDDVHRLQVVQRVCVNLLDHCLHFVNHLVHSWLQVCIIVLDVVN